MGDRLVVGPAPRRPLPVRRALRWAVVASLFALLAGRLFFAELVGVRGNTMAPAVLDGDALFILRHASPRLGDVVLVEHADRAVLRRVVGLPSETVGAADGILTRGGLPLETHIEGTFTYLERTDAEGEAPPPRRQHHAVEAISETRSHRILGDQVGATPPWSLELPTLDVPPGHLFLLCDNRRTCPLDELAGIVPAAWVRGVARYLVWRGEARVEGPGAGWAGFKNLTSGTL
jgi:signal peptidase I